MSVDQTGNTGITKANPASPLTTDLSTLSVADFVDGDVLAAKYFMVYMDASGGDITIAPSTTFVNPLLPGYELIIAKAQTGGKITFVDPYTGWTIEHTDVHKDSMTLVFDGTQWIYKF